ncbi:hypothetical protein T09_2151, partial [Trichinella sp. T9]
LLAVSNHRFSSLKRWSVRGFPTMNRQHLLRVTTSHGQRIAVNVIRRRGQRDSFSQEMTVRIRLSPVRLMTCSRSLWPISLLGGACRQLRTKWQSEKHRHEALNASKGSPDEHCLHSLDTMAEQVRHDDKDTTSDCSRKELESIVCAADLTELLSYYISDELQMVLCDVEARINDCPLTLISSMTHDMLPLSPVDFLIGQSLSSITDEVEEKHRHEALNASKGSPDEHCLHSLDTMAERELESIVCAADLTELLSYYISDELQMVLCDVEAPINDCPLTLIFSGTQDKLALTSAQGSSRLVALFTYCWLNSLFYCALYLLSY